MACSGSAWDDASELPGIISVRVLRQDFGRLYGVFMRGLPFSIRVWVQSLWSRILGSLLQF